MREPYSVATISLPISGVPTPVLSADVTILTATAGQAVGLTTAVIGRSLKAINVGTNAITVRGASVDTVKGAATLSLPAGTAVEFIGIPANTQVAGGAAVWEAFPRTPS